MSGSGLTVVEPNGQVTFLRYRMLFRFLMLGGLGYPFKGYSGVFIVDSVAVISGPHAWTQYLVVVLRAAMHLSGQPAAAVVCRGACFSNGIFERALQHIMALFTPAPQWMVWIVSGQELFKQVARGRYTARPEQWYDDPVRDEVWQPGCRIISVAERWCPRQRLVFGYSSELWRSSPVDQVSLYGGTPRDCGVYDVLVSQCIEGFAGEGIACISGDSVLRGICIDAWVSLGFPQWRLSHTSLADIAVTFGMLATWEHHLHLRWDHLTWEDALALHRMQQRSERARL